MQTIHAAAVLVPIIHRDSEWHFLFTKRSDKVNDHKGQVSFPGGRVEEEDVDITHAALREASEEIGICHQDVRVLGAMNGFLTVSNYWVNPIIAELKWPVKLTLSEDEVSKVFSIPVTWFVNYDNLQISDYSDSEGLTRSVIYYRKYNNELVWGITARIIYNLLNLVK